jgi:hypothetical protein
VVGIEKGAESKKTNVLRLEKNLFGIGNGSLLYGKSHPCTSPFRIRSGNLILEQVRSGPDQEISSLNKSVPDL